jgi:signal transduction histidine kinase
MLSHLQIARSNEFAPETREASLALVHQEIRRTSQLVQEMTTLASLQVAAPTEMRLIDIVLIADDALSRVALVAEERQIGIELVTESAIPRIHGHADRLLQVFINLLDNALKYSRPGDNVTLRLSNRHTHVVCEIQDTGPGIPAEHLPHLTQRLYRVRRDEDGHGLGLAIVEEILRGHGSRLEVESAVDGERTGTRMGFQLHITTTP